jgi:uncharacterized membrane protein
VSNIEQSIDVSVPVRSVYDQWTQFEEFPRFMEGVHRLGDNETRVMVQMDVEPEGAVEKAGDALGLVKRRVHGDLERFKELIEGRGSASGAWRGEVRQTKTH